MHCRHQVILKVKVLVAQSRPTLWDPIDYSQQGSSVPEIFQAKHNGVGCQFLLQGIFLTQESNLGLPHCKQIFFYHLSHHKHIHIWVPQVVLVVENLPANAGELRGAGSIPGLGRIPGRGQATHSSILAWKIPWTKEPGELQSIGLQRVGHN